MDSIDIEDHELELLLSTLLVHHRLDFTNYAKASLKRGVKRHVEQAKLRYISELIPKVIHEPQCINQLLDSLTIRVSEMFRDPQVFLTIRQKVLPVLRTYPRINIWHIGCASGEEIYSMAIMLLEEGLLNKSHLYATDISDTAIQNSKNAIYDASKMALFSENYLKAGGTRDISDYFTMAYGSIKLQDYLKEHVTFAYHNLTQDPEFAEVHLVMCRNVLIYFNQSLQDQSLSKFKDTLIHRGWLVLGDKETLNGTSIQSDFDNTYQSLRIFQKKLPKVSE